ncbi:MULTISPECIES: NADPH-dependent FMN reductase [Aeromicrobium]|uniref:NADPH-dependent FMN reductase n=1 Tax=Aeromicrobium TaxID=2040 RepID=UPI00188E0DAB|nr:MULTISPECIES: NAD(P)H-dependent oxidoreductase [Aeromicrobium]
MHHSPLIVGLCGNPAPASKTLTLTTEVTAALADLFAGAATEVIDLSTHAERVLVWGDEAVAASRDLLRSADLLVVATPVYKGAYTGLLKAFLDGFDLGELANVLAVPVTVAASPAHALAGPTHLEPVLREIGCLVPGGTLHVPDKIARDADARSVLVAEWISVRTPMLATAGRELVR